MRRLRPLILLWWHYGAKGREKLFRVFLALLAVLAFLVLLLEIIGVIHISGLLPGLLANLALTADMEKLATALGIASAIMAGACMTFMGALVPQAMECTESPSGELRIRALIGLSVAFLASFIAAVTFGILVAVTDVEASAQHWAVMFAALTLLVTSSLLLIFVLILLLPNGTEDSLGAEFGNVFSLAWLVFFGLLILIGQAAPKWGEAVGRPMLAAVLLSLLQIAVPHGHLRYLWDEERYMGFLQRMNAYANRCFMMTVVATIALLIVVLASPNLGIQAVEFWLWVLLLLWATGLLLLQVWVEGTRKMLRYPRFPEHVIERHPQLAAILGTGVDRPARR